MLLLQGLGQWIVTVNGGLNSISEDILEAASLDGANAWQLAWRVKLPMIRQWIGYAALLNLAYGFQLFLEPYLLNQVAAGALPSEYTPTQLGYWFAFVGTNFPAAAAMSVIIVIITLAIGLVVVFPRPVQRRGALMTTSSCAPRSRIDVVRSVVGMPAGSRASPS